MNGTQIQLRVGVGITEITPPLEVGLLTSSARREWKPFESVRTPLMARALVLEWGTQKVALLSLDLLGLASETVGGWTNFKRAVARGTENQLHPGQIVIACTHTHNAPESIGLTNLRHTSAFREWVKQLRQKLSLVLQTALETTCPCTLSIATTELNNFSLQRRIPTKAGIVMSDALQPIAPELFLRTPIDRRVRTVRFHRTNGSVIATLIHAVCHPVHEMCLPHVSGDFPGDLCRALQNQPGMGEPFFFNGAAADINPPTVSVGRRAAQRHGEELARVVTKSILGDQVMPSAPIQFRRRTVQLPTRSKKNGKPARRTRAASISALRMGNLALVFLPGEIFSQTADQIEKSSPFQNTIVIGFAESSVGYVPPSTVFHEGGYEVGPGNWSYLQITAESILRKEVARLLNELAEPDFPIRPQAAP